MDVVNRTFVGVRLPGHQWEMVSEKLMSLKRKPGVENVRWSAPSELLLNLASLGELEVGTLSSLKSVLRDVAARHTRLELEIKGFGGLPNLIQPRYVYAGIEGPDASLLGSLAEDVDRSTRPYTPQRDSRPFHAHILLGRLKTENEQYRVGLGRALKLMEPPSMGAWAIEHLELLISSASTSGIGYEVVEICPLA